MAALFGTGAIADAFQVAFRVPNMLRDLLAEGAMSSAFVPTYAAYREREGSAAALRVADCVMTAAMLATVLLCVAGYIYAVELVGMISDGFAGDQGKLALSVRLTRTLLPVLGVISVAAVWTGVLNAEGRHLPPACGPMIFNVISIAAGVYLLASGVATQLAVDIWAWATLIGVCGQALLQLVALVRGGYVPRLRLLSMWQEPGVRRVLKLMAPAVVGVAAVQINVAFNTRFASALGDGPVAQLSYAFRIFYLPVGMFSVALATVTTTRVADGAAKGELTEVAVSAREGLAGVWVLMLASALGIGILAEPIVATAFQRGAYTASDSVATGWVLRAYAFALVPYGLVKVLAPVFYGLERPRIALEGSVLAVAVNLGFNALTFRTLGAPGIALGTGLGAVANVVYLSLRFRTLMPASPAAGTAGQRLAALAFAGGVLAAICWAGLWVLPQLSGVLSGWLLSLLRTAVLLMTVVLAGSAYIAILAWRGHPMGERLAKLLGGRIPVIGRRLRS